ncbi:MAG: hypothetical protein ACI4D7_04680 [Lachnospiraceae bacterium]
MGKNPVIEVGNIQEEEKSASGLDKKAEEGSEKTKGKRSRRADWIKEPEKCEKYPSGRTDWVKIP